MREKSGVLVLRKKFISIYLGEIAWMLSGTYGLPLAVTQKICNQKGLKVDVDGFHQCLTKFQVIFLFKHYVA